jgi:hypothetical protein
MRSKVLTCPLELVTRKSSLRCILLSILIAVIYQYHLSHKKLTDYIFDPEDRHTLIDQNKEGIFSTIGYVSIYLAGEALCYKLNYLLKEKLVYFIS